MDTEIIAEKVNALIKSSPCFREYKNKIMVVKYGGSAMVDNELEKSLAEDFAFLKSLGFKLVIVHGGGKEINKWVEKLGIKNTFVNGLRVTDEQTMEIAEMVLSRLNKKLVQIIEQSGIKAAGISGKDGGTIKVVKRYENNVDLGYVGKIKKIDTGLINVLLDNNFIPVISPVGLDDMYQEYNINADDAACAIATSLKAENLIFLTGIQGVCKDPKDPSTLIRELTVPEAKEFLCSGNAGGGMLPKLAGCIEAVESGVSHVHIIDGRVRHSLLNEFFTNKVTGTMILNYREGNQ